MPDGTQSGNTSRYGGIVLSRNSSASSEILPAKRLGESGGPGSDGKFLLAAMLFTAMCLRRASAST